MTDSNKTEFDSPWKEIIEFFFPQFMEFFVPGSEKVINWNKKIKFLDKEFQKITKESADKRRYTDKLVEVVLKNNEKKWVLIHVEVQAQKEMEFSERMFVYNYRIFDRYGIPVTSIAILADNTASWNPEPFKYGMWGSSMGLDYIKTKLLDYKVQWSYLEKEENPFAIVVMAHLKALETRKDHLLRKQWKTELTKLLYEKGYSKTGILNLYRFIDWVLTLPEALEKIFLEDLRQYEKEKNMPYITSAERIGKKEGKKEGRKEGMLSFVQKAKQQGVSAETIARIVDLDITLINKILNHEKVEVPLHLLDLENNH
ncbi:MAG: hypothetical protein KAI50_10710 [Desulfobacterales bacterium]|nr:hypothetical protein [Desulfobacterales bacterium]